MCSRAILAQAVSRNSLVGLPYASLRASTATPSPTSSQWEELTHDALCLVHVDIVAEHCAFGLVLVVYLPLCVLASGTVRTDVLVLRVGEETSIRSAWWRDLCLSVCLQGSRLRTRHTSSRTRDLLSILSSWCFLSCPDGLSTELSDLSSRLECLLLRGSRHNAGYHRSTAISGRFPQVWQRLFGQLLVRNASVAGSPTETSSLLVPNNSVARKRCSGNHCRCPTSQLDA